MNFDWKSCKGFSIENVLLDFAGGMLSLIGELLKIYFYSDDFFGDKTNIPKIALSVVVIVFDIILIY